MLNYQRVTCTTTWYARPRVWRRTALAVSAASLAFVVGSRWHGEQKVSAEHRGRTKANKVVWAWGLGNKNGALNQPNSTSAKSTIPFLPYRQATAWHGNTAATHLSHLPRQVTPERSRRSLCLGWRDAKTSRTEYCLRWSQLHPTIVGQQIQNIPQAHPTLV